MKWSEKTQNMPGMFKKGKMEIIIHANDSYIVPALKAWTKAITVNNVNYRMTFEYAIQESDDDTYSFIIYHHSHLHKIKWGDDKSRFGEIISQLEQRIGTCFAPLAEIVSTFQLSFDTVTSVDPVTQLRIPQQTQDVRIKIPKKVVYQQLGFLPPLKAIIPWCIELPVQDRDSAKWRYSMLPIQHDQRGYCDKGGRVIHSQSNPDHVRHIDCLRCFPRVKIDEEVVARELCVLCGDYAPASFSDGPPAAKKIEKWREAHDCVKTDIGAKYKPATLPDPPPSSDQPETSQVLPPMLKRTMAKMESVGAKLPPPVKQRKKPKQKNSTAPASGSGRVFQPRF